MQEYVFRIVRRSSPVNEVDIIEFGTPCSDAAAFASAIENIAGLLKIHGTPEKVVEAMKKHKRVEGIKELILSGS